MAKLFGQLFQMNHKFGDKLKVIKSNCNIKDCGCHNYIGKVGVATTKYILFNHPKNLYSINHFEYIKSEWDKEKICKLKSFGEK